MESWRQELYSSELYHHGILGQKWVVRRYQNYDGSYTKKGLARYNEAEKKYTDTKAKYKQGSASKEELRGAKKEMNKQYKQLKLDYRADKGKELYKSGKTITDLQNTRDTLLSGIGIAGGAAATWFANNPQTLNTPLGEMKAMYAILGVNALAALGVAASYQPDIRNLRAYYAH